MNIEDEEVEREEFVPKTVGRGLLAQFENEEDQQWYLANSEHPYAPFPGNALKWESFVYSDGTSFEGLARENIPHGKGVMTFGTGTGAGINLVEPGDRYEGEFFAGFANGLGSFTSASGEVYRGEWMYGKRHGCGAVTNFTPYLRELRKGATPAEAWKRTKATILSKRMRYGSWQRNKFVREAGEDEGETCSVSDVRGILQEMESVVTKSRMFQYKPDGDATHLNLRDGNGVPVPVFQDPLHYPHGTKFLAPGPLGQCHPVPDNENLKREMRKHARNYMRIYNQYNLPFLARPGDDLFAAARLHEIERLKAEHFRRLAAGEDEAAIIKDLDAQLQGLQLGRVEPAFLVQRAEPEQPPPTTPTPGAGKGRGARGRKEEAPPEEPATPPDDSDIDESDLIASTDFPPSVFCSMSGRSRGLNRIVMAARKTSAEILPRVFRRSSIGSSHQQ